MPEIYGHSKGVDYFNATNVQKSWFGYCGAFIYIYMSIGDFGSGLALANETPQIRWVCGSYLNIINNTIHSAADNRIHARTLLNEYITSTLSHTGAILRYMRPHWQARANPNIHINKYMYLYMNIHISSATGRKFSSALSRLAVIIR